MKRIDLINQKFNKLLVTSSAGSRKYPSGNRPIWNCVCDCGKKLIVTTSALKRGQVSCGCHRLENNHRDSSSPEYQAWSHARRRCHEPKDPAYKNYGARGITMCKSWRNDYEQFLSDMGRKPSSLHSLDRIDNTRGYTKSNCRWCTEVVQQNNKRNNIPEELKNQVIKLRDAGYLYREIAEQLSIHKSKAQYIYNYWRNKNVE